MVEILRASLSDALRMTVFVFALETGKDFFRRLEAVPWTKTGVLIQSEVAAITYCFESLENLGSAILPSMRKGKVSLPSTSLAPSKRAKVLVKKPCLVVMVATPW